jgi:predicted methyltransferase
MGQVRLLSVLNEAHRLVGERVAVGDCVVDATMGNGNDTLFLARCVGTTGYVYGFDIQAEAYEHTWERLIRERITMEQINLIIHSHDKMESSIPEAMHGQVAAIMFNLGYLPGGEQSLITKTDTTIEALNASLRLLRSGGILTIVVYPGHQGGDEEALTVHSWATKLSHKSYQVTAYQFLNATTVPPYLISVYKI